jgi:Zn-dependent peptidase ImmA (M78 family)
VLVKHGLNGWVLQEESAACFKISDLLTPLEAFGSSLAEELARRGGSHEEAAVSAWRSRLVYTSVEAAQIVTGFSREELELIQQASDEFNSEVEVLRRFEDPSQSELLAAARMSAGLTPGQIAAIVSFVASVPAIETPELDDLSIEATAVRVGSDYAYDEGLEIARWFRRWLGIGPGKRINPEDLLRRFSVSVQESRLASSVDAVAVWGRRHGPCVLINTAGKHAQGLAGRRASTAHEIAHLLLDRTGALPVAEVLQGQVVSHVEARARAFAAELLLPQEEAAAAYLSLPDAPERVVRSLVSRYGVSLELAAWQIRNSGTAISPRSRAALRGFVRQPLRY